MLSCPSRERTKISQACLSIVLVSFSALPIVLTRPNSSCGRVLWNFPARSTSPLLIWHDTGGSSVARLSRRAASFLWRYACPGLDAGCFGRWNINEGLGGASWVGLVLPISVVCGFDGRCGSKLLEPVRGSLERWAVDARTPPLTCVCVVSEVEFLH